MLAAWTSRAFPPNPVPVGFYIGDTRKYPRAGLQQDYYEWGGENADGSDGFKQNRPGWPAPIHRLLVQYKVNIVFP
jgi:hypothetical protein